MWFISLAQPNGSQRPGGEAACIDTDSARQVDRHGLGRVAMHQQWKPAGLDVRLVPKPQQVVFGLIGEVHTIAQSGMRKDQSRHRQHHRQLFEKPPMLIGNMALQNLELRVSVGGAILVERDAVGEQGFLATEIEPPHGLTWRPQMREHHVLVVAGQADAAEPSRRRIAKVVEDAGRLRTTIDIVADHDDQFVAFFVPGVGDDLLVQLAQLLEAPVHIPNGVHQRRPFWQVDDGTARRPRRFASKQVLKQGPNGQRPELGRLSVATPAASTARNRTALAGISRLKSASE